VLRFLFYRVMPEPIELNQSSWVDLALSVVRPSNGLWFLFALVVFLVVTKALGNARMPRTGALVLAAIASLALQAGLTTGNVAYDGILRYYVFFLAGVMFRSGLLRAVERMGGVTIAILLAAFLAGLALRAVSGVAVDVVTALPVAVAGALGTLGIARVMARRRIGRPFAYLGRRTLQVYVTHVLVLSALTTALMAPVAAPLVAATGPVLPPLMAAVAVVVSLAFSRLAESLPVARLLYAPPAWFARRPVRAG
jgi:uncharacterized membrane protein YcfT